MGLKTKIAMAMGTSAAGAAMLVGGSFAFFTASAQTNSNTFTAGTVSLNVDQSWSDKSSNGVNISNLAPGDTATVSFNVKNTGSLAEWVALETTPENVAGGKTYQADGTLQSAGYANAGLFTSFKSSIDAASGGSMGQYHDLSGQGAAGSGQLAPGTITSGSNADFTADEHPAQYWYSVTDSSGNTVSSEGSGTSLDTGTLSGLSVNDWGQAYQHAFLLPAGATATVTYNVYLPAAAHNDYQHLQGALNVEVDAVQARNNWTVKGSQTRGTGDPSTAPAGSTVVPWSWQPEVQGN